MRLEFCKLSLKISSSEAAPTPSYRIYAWICWIEILKDKEMICNVATMAAASRYKYQGAIGTRCRFKFKRRSKGLEFLQEFLSSTAAFSATMCHKRCGEQTIHNFLVETFGRFQHSQLWSLATSGVNRACHWHEGCFETGKLQSSHINCQLRVPVRRRPKMLLAKKTINSYLITLSSCNSRKKLSDSTGINLQQNWASHTRSKSPGRSSRKDK